MLKKEMQAKIDDLDCELDIANETIDDLKQLLDEANATIESLRAQNAALAEQVGQKAIQQIPEAPRGPFARINRRQSRYGDFFNVQLREDCGRLQWHEAEELLGVPLKRECKSREDYQGNRWVDLYPA